MEKQKVGIWKQNDEGYWYTPRIPENQKLFNELMKRKPIVDPATAYDYSINDEDDDWDENSVFTDEEIEFLGKFNLPEFSKKFPNEAEYYMDELS
jgi:hypothetical protein